MGNYSRPVWAEVDVSAIAHNIQVLRELLLPQTQLMAVVKANGYGHGAKSVAKIAVTGGAQRLGVALIEEALELRDAGLSVPIHIFQEPPAQAAHEIVEAGLIPTLTQLELAGALSAEAARRRRTVKAHVKVDSGMSRLGLLPADVPGFLRACHDLPGLKIEGVYTHFATAECPEARATLAQKRVFEELVRDLEAAGMKPPLVHAANSAATILMPQTHYDIVRCGIAVYGLHPSGSTKERIDLKPALSLKALISAVREIEEGAGVSYGHTFRTSAPTRIATVPLGYADGYSRRLSNRGSALIDGRRLPIAGTICMDQLMVDVGESKVDVGDEVTLIGRSGGESISADDLAHLLDTINYEVVCAIGGRVPRLYT
ncbi:MAG: alanine racemase [Actinobacteria bacterium]|nr:MAG: alanine racemase [Actinomycetota bacterium]